MTTVDEQPTEFKLNSNIEEDSNNIHWIRRSERNPANSHVERRDVKDLLSKIRGNHADSVILKVKDHIISDVHITVLDAILDSLKVNTVCQALYVQNLGKALTDTMLDKLVLLLIEKDNIWGLNIGENYEVFFRENSSGYWCYRTNW